MPDPLMLLGAIVRRLRPPRLCPVTALGCMTNEEVDRL